MSRQHTYGMGRRYLRGRIWWIRYYRNGQEFNESSRSEKEADAKKLLKRRLGEIALGRFSGPKAEKVTFAELAQDLLTDYRIRGRKNRHKVKSKADHLLAFFGNDRAQSITTDRVKAYIAKRQEDVPKGKKDGTSAAQINRELAALKRAFNLALQAEKIAKKPYFPMLEEQNVRTGFFECEEFAAVRDALPFSLRPVTTFGYYTGWRIEEILNLQWRQVNLDTAEVRLDSGTTKSGEGRVIYLDGELLDTIKTQRAWVLDLQRERGEIIAWVFINPDTGDRWRDFRKDFRRTAVRNMVRAGVPEVVAMKITGHKTRSVFDRYNIVSEEDLREAARRISAPRQKIGTKPGQSLLFQPKPQLRRNRKYLIL